LNNAVNAALASPDVAGKLADMGSSKVAGSRKDFEAYIAKEIPRWETLVKKSGAKID
jgi:tripartite-type tricarboxylate transporter receptor subunit TctC